MLPSEGGRDKRSAFQVMLYTFFLIPAACLPCWFGLSGYISALTGVVLSVLFFIQSVKLYKNCDIASARELMFGSFAYLPLMQIVLLIDKA